MTACTTSREFQVLCCCAIPRIDEARGDAIASLVRDGIDWPLAIDAATQHGLLPLLHHHVMSVCPDGVPAAANEMLRRFEDHESWSLQQYVRLRLALNSLQKAGIPAIPWKGPALAQSLYGSIALRPSGDLDLLIHRPDFEAARDLMLSLGFRPVHRMSPEQEQQYLACECEYPLRHKASGQLLELQWDFVPRYFSLSLPLEEIWRRARLVPVNGQPTLQLSAEDTLLILCIHGGKHVWPRLVWLSDVAELMRRKVPMDWEYLVRLARRVGAERLLFTGLMLATELLDAPLPDQMLGLARSDGAVAALVDELRRKLAALDDRPLSLVEQSLFHLRMRERWRNRLAYCWRAAVTPSLPEFETVALPQQLGWLYRFIRPVRLVRRYTPSVRSGVLRRSVA